MRHPPIIPDVPEAEVAAISKRLTPARRKAILNARPGYCDDDSLDPAGRRMFHFMVEDGLLEYRTDPHHPMLSIFLTGLGVLVQRHLEAAAKRKAPGNPHVPGDAN